MPIAAPAAAKAPAVANAPPLNNAEDFFLASISNFAEFFISSAFATAPSLIPSKDLFIPSASLSATALCLEERNFKAVTATITPAARPVNAAPTLPIFFGTALAAASPAPPAPPLAASASLAWALIFEAAASSYLAWVLI